MATWITLPSRLKIFTLVCCCCCLVAKLCLTICDPMDCSPPRILCPWDSSGKSTGVGCPSLFQGIFLTQGSNPHLLLWQADSLAREPSGKLRHMYISLPLFLKGFPWGSDSKASAYNAGDPGSIPGSGSSPGEGNGNSLQYSCLENPVDGGVP